MFINFLKSIFRNLWKNKGYSFLNIFGLAVGIMAAALIFLWVENEVTRNDHFLHKKDISIVKSLQKNDHGYNVFEGTQGLLAPSIKAEIPGIKYAVRMDWGASLLFSLGDKSLYQNGYYADPEILDMLSVEFIAGDPKTAMSKPNDIILSETGAKLLFADEPAIGKNIRINNEEEYTVTAVVKNFPKNSNFSFNWLIPFSKYEQGKDWLQTWGNNAVITLVQIEPNADLAEINKTLLDYVERKTDGKITFSQNMLYPMSRWNLYNVFDNAGHEQEGGLKSIRLFSIIAWIVLLIACINFMNLATARSEKRAKEIGLRKVVGASRGSLVVQFLGESMIYAMLSAVLAIGLVYLCIGPFNAMLGKTLSVDLFKPLHLSFILGVALTCGLLAGSYPALYLSAFNPLMTIKGAKQKAGSTGFIRRGLVVLQYAASIILIICTMIIYQQIEYSKNRDLGMSSSQVVTTAVRGDMLQHLDLIKEQLKANPQIAHVGLSNMNVFNIGANSMGLEWEGKAPGSQILIGILHSDEELLPSLSMKLHDGRNFHPHLHGDSSSVLVNEAFARIIQADGMVSNKTLKWGEENYTIVGVVKDFVYNNIYSAAEPLIFMPFSDNKGVLNIKIKEGTNLFETIPKIEKIIKANNQAYPFEYKFLDDTFQAKFHSELFIQKLASFFAILSIIISCLGLFGLASYSAEQRAKEVSIRKVLGASITRLVGLLNKEFILLVSISCLIAFPIAWWYMKNWLADYSYRIDIQWFVFVLAAGLALLIAIISISSQALRAARSNPTKTLRNN